MITPQEIRTFAREAARRAEDLRSGSMRAPAEQVLQEMEALVEELQVSGEELRIQNEELLDILGNLDIERSRSRGLFELAPSPLLTTDRTGRIRDANEAALRLLGMRESLFDRKPLAVFVEPGDRRRFRSYLDRVRRAGPSEEFGAGDVEVSVVVRSGPPLPVRVSSRPVPTTREGGEILWSLQDVRPLRKREEARIELEKETAQRLAAQNVSQRVLFLLRSITDLSRLLDPREVARRAAELAAAEFAALAVVDVVDGATVARASEGPGARTVESNVPSLDEGGLLATMVDTGSSVEGPAGADDVVRRHLVGDAATPLPGDLDLRTALVLPMLARRGVVGTLTLVRSEHDAPMEPGLPLFARGFAQVAGLAVDQALRFHEVAREKERLDALSRDRFNALTSLAHELRTPLHSILGYCDLLLEGISGELAPSVARMVGAVRASALHQAELVNGSLDFFRSEAAGRELHLDDVVVQDVLRQAATMVEELARQKGLTLGLDAPDEPVRARTDAGKLRQVLVNLLGNAVKYTDEGHVRLRASERDGSLVVEVEDTGDGISEDEIGHVFEPFWRSPGTRAGSGLGLTVTQRLVDLLGGTVDVESEPGRGSVFRVVLPLEQEPREPGHAASDDAPSAAT